MRNEGLQKTLIAGAAVTKNRVLKFGADDLSAIHAAASTDLLMGVSDNLGASSGEPFDVIIDGIALVEYGGNVTRGDMLTSDSVGRAVAAAPAAGVNARVIGVSMISGVLGDIGSVRLAPGRIQG
ncbi:MAG: capsid cement protein [bacterium]|jgi:hypothetical protein